MEIRAIGQKLAAYRRAGRKLFATSSFQTQSAVLLHILSQTDPSVPVYFINTGFHFPETIRYKDMLAEMLGIRVIDLLPHVPKVMQTNAAGNLMFTYDPDYCCYLNKVQPVQSLLEKYDVWVNGVRADQNGHRSRFREEEMTSCQTLRYHPLIGWTEGVIREYIALHKLPVHPLEEKGYRSIGCEPCTRPANGSDLRDARWPGMKKTECGLHEESGG